MPVLIIHQGSEDLYLEPSKEKTYAYRIGAGQIVGRVCEYINDVPDLNKISEELRDGYASWIYNFNQEFLDAVISSRDFDNIPNSSFLFLTLSISVFSLLLSFMIFV